VNVSRRDLRGGLFAASASTPLLGVMSLQWL
jgi:hypothetical protein